MYDPVQGRMLSPDNYVSTPFGTQGYNRYAYAMNNPLVYTDPDGQWVHIVIGAAIGGVINLAVKAAQGKIHNFRDGIVAFGIGAAAGAATGGASFLAVGGGASGAGGFLAGMIGGASGAAIASPIQGIGNSIYFGDTWSPKQWITDIAVGGLLGGATNGIIALVNGRTFGRGAIDIGDIINTRADIRIDPVQAITEEEAIVNNSIADNIATEKMAQVRELGRIGE